MCIIIFLKFTVFIYGIISLGLAFLVSKLGMILQVSAVTVMSIKKLNCGFEHPMVIPFYQLHCQIVVGFSVIIGRCAFQLLILLFEVQTFAC